MGALQALDQDVPTEQIPSSPARIPGIPSLPEDWFFPEELVLEATDHYPYHGAPTLRAYPSPPGHLPPPGPPREGVRLASNGNILSFSISHAAFLSCVSFSAALSLSVSLPLTVTGPWKVVHLTEEVQKLMFGWGLLSDMEHTSPFADVSLSPGHVPLRGAFFHTLSSGLLPHFQPLFFSIFNSPSHTQPTS